MHTLVLHLQDITDCLCSSDPIIRKCKNLIQEQKIAFLRCDHFARKIQSIENIGFLLCLLLLIQFLISFIMLLKTEYLNIQIIQFLQKIQFPALSSFQKLNNNDAFPLSPFPPLTFPYYFTYKFAISILAYIFHICQKDKTEGLRIIELLEDI